MPVEIILDPSSRGTKISVEPKQSGKNVLQRSTHFRIVADGLLSISPYEQREHKYSGDIREGPARSESKPPPMLQSGV